MHYIDLTAARTDLGPGTYELGTIPAQEGEAQHRDALSCVCYTNSGHSGTVTIRFGLLTEPIHFAGTPTKSPTLSYRADSFALFQTLLSDKKQLFRLHEVSSMDPIEICAA